MNSQQNILLKAQIMLIKIYNYIPVLTANQAFILGYTNDTEGNLSILVNVLFLMILLWI